MGVAATAQTPADSSDIEPFHDFRRQTLEYAGPDDVQANSHPSRIAIGWFGPDDPGHPMHGDLWAAAQLAVEEANRAADGVSYELLPRWSETVWGTGVAEVARMAYESDVVAILGSVDGSSTHLVEQIVAKARLPLVSPVSSDDSIQLAGVPWMFSVAPGDRQWTATLARTLTATVGEGRFALVGVTDHDSRLATRALLDALAALDTAPARRLDLRPGTTDLEARLDRLDLAGQAALLLVAGPDDGARILQAVRATGFTGPIFGGPRLARRRCLESPAAEGLRVPLMGEPSDAAAASDFAERFHQRTGSYPDWAAVHTYDAARLLLETVRAAGPSRTEVRKALADLPSRQGLSGRIEWDPTGRNSRTVTTVATVRGGRLAVD